MLAMLKVNYLYLYLYWLHVVFVQLFRCCFSFCFGIGFCFCFSFCFCFIFSCSLFVVWLLENKAAAKTIRESISEFRQFRQPTHTRHTHTHTHTQTQTVQRTCFYYYYVCFSPFFEAWPARHDWHTYFVLLRVDFRPDSRPYLPSLPLSLPLLLLRFSYVLLGDIYTHLLDKTNAFTL